MFLPLSLASRCLALRFSRSLACCSSLWSAMLLYVSCSVCRAMGEAEVKLPSHVPAILILLRGKRAQGGKDMHPHLLQIWSEQEMSAEVEHRPISYVMNTLEHHKLCQSSSMLCSTELRNITLTISNTFKQWFILFFSMFLCQPCSRWDAQWICWILRYLATVSVTFFLSPP